jgi:hypothetical protein
MTGLVVFGILSLLACIFCYSWGFNTGFDHGFGDATAKRDARGRFVKRNDPTKPARGPDPQ